MGFEDLGNATMMERVRITDDKILRVRFMWFNHYSCTELLESFACYTINVEKEINVFRLGEPSIELQSGSYVF